MSQQNLQNHARYVPLFHFITFGLVMLNLIRAVRGLLPVTNASLYDAGVAVALVLMCWFLRAFPLTVQDRVIRLEERLRLQALAGDLSPRAGSITTAQWTALRFASDAEFPALVRDVLDCKLVKPIDIKRAIKDWRADTLRA